MQLSLRFQILSLFALAATTFAAPGCQQTPVGATYFMTNNPEENAIVIHDVFADGTVSYAKTVPTGQKGASNQLTGPPAPDALRTEGSIVISGNMLYNVNPGSDSVTMWEINPHDPTDLKMVGKPVNTGGNFPGSVVVSKKTGRVCVANGGTINGVQCFSPTRGSLAKISNSNRILGFNQTTPATQSDTLNSMSTIMFSPDESKLLVDVKGQMTQAVPGYIASWDVMPDGSLSKTHQTFTAPSKVGALPFGMTYLNGKDGYVASDPTVGGIIWDFSKGWSQKQMRSKSFVLPGQAITCWTTYASKSDSYFMTDFGTQIVFEAKIDSNTLDTQIINKFQLPNNTINIDTVVGNVGNNQYLYQLAPFGSSLFVFDVQPNGMTKLIQSYNFTQGLMSDRVKYTSYSPVGLAFHTRS